jgi:hypothetical protein
MLERPRAMIACLTSLSVVACSATDQEEFEVGEALEEVAVTGQGSDPTFNKEQAEAAVVWTSNGGSSIIVVSYNDKGAEATNPKIIYKDNYKQRTLLRGVSLMGWSTSTDDGASYSYRGRIYPPTGWSAVWGDPWLVAQDPTIPNIENRKVFISNLGSSDAKFPPSGEVVDEGMSNYLDGLCVARLKNGGQDADRITCFKYGTCSGSGGTCMQNGTTSDCPSGQTCDGKFFDGTAMEFTTKLYVASRNVTDARFDVFTSDDLGVSFRRLPRPFPNDAAVLHPRLQEWSGRLYVAAQRSDGLVIASYLKPDGTWHPRKIVSNPAVIAPTILLGGDRNIRTANQWDFDVTRATDGGPQDWQLRAVYVRRNASNKHYIEGVKCKGDLPGTSNPEVADCTVPPAWNLELVYPGDSFNPVLRAADEGFVFNYFADYRLTFLNRPNPNNQTLIYYRGQLVDNGYGPGPELQGPATPCSTLSSAGDTGYWGDYNDMSFKMVNGQATFVGTFTQNDESCDYRSSWTAEMHVGAVTWQ